MSDRKTQHPLMADPMCRDLVIANKTRLRIAYELLADVRNLSITKDLREIIGQDDRELKAACAWLTRRLRMIECAIGNPMCLECGCPMDPSDTVCSVCEWKKGDSA